MGLDDFVSLVRERGAELYRDLPWRNVDDPYAVLLSEVMLQQTQVQRADGRWQAWLEQFPTVDSLAAAPLPPVLEAWQGMGYNRRAKALHDCALQIVERFGGEVPRGYDELVSLPGVGPATAGGVRVFAFREPDVYLETNVRTVFIHELFPERDDVSDAEIVPLVRETCDVSDPRGWYYALLDYGAYLKKNMPNPSRRSKHHTRQSKFEGSRRQKRAFLLRCVLDDDASTAQLASLLDEEERAAGRDAAGEELTASILVDLAGEGMIVHEDDVWRVAD